MNKDNDKVTKEIFNRLNCNHQIYLYDSYDASKIIIDDDLLNIIRQHYKNKLKVM